MAWGVFHWMWRFGDIGVLARWAERALVACGDPGTVRMDSAVSARLRAAVSWARFLVGDVAGRSRRRNRSTSRPSRRRTPPARPCCRTRGPWPCRCPTVGVAAREAAERALTLADSAAFVAVRAYSHAFLAGLDLVNRDFASAEQHCRVSVDRDRIRLHSLAGQQHAQLALAAIAQGQIDEGCGHFAAALDSLREHNLLDVAFLLGHAAVLAAAEGRAADAAARGRLRRGDDPPRARPLAHVRRSRLAALAPTGSKVADVPAEVADADPWDVLRATLALPTPPSGSTMAPTPGSQTSP